LWPEYRHADLFDLTSPRRLLAGPFEAGIPPVYSMRRRVRRGRILMSTRKDGLSIAAAGQTVRYLLDGAAVEVCGGNARHLHVRRRDGQLDPGAATGRYGLSLDNQLALHGFRIARHGADDVIDLLECDGDLAEHRMLAGALELQAARDARAEWTWYPGAPTAGAELAGRSAGDQEREWCAVQTVAFLRDRLSRVPHHAPPAGWEERAVERARRDGVLPPTA
jgi:hypothetical protein